ncbi:MAG: HNH endonuclease [Chloroflexi bacterium]|nr:HNH endonuclease [Chloroflexota bacterium]
MPLTPCLEPRCPHPAVHRGHCERHRQSTSQRGYGRAWQATSRAIRHLHGQCERCGAVDDLTVDHIVPRSMGGSDERANLRVLCRSCHGAIGAKRAGAPPISTALRPSGTCAGVACTYKEAHEGGLSPP